MNCIMLKSKLHMGCITEARADYEGSITIDRDLMDAVKILPYEKVLVSNSANTNRFETYVIEGAPGSGVVCLNGPASRQGAVGDRVVILSFCSVPAEEARRHRPLILTLDEKNRPTGPLKET